MFSCVRSVHLRPELYLFRFKLNPSVSYILIFFPNGHFSWRNYLESVVQKVAEHF